jgi:hypothetical protein
MAAYATDKDGLLTCFNAEAAFFAGRCPQVGRDRWCVTWRLYWPDGRSMAHEECPMATALRENRSVRGQDAIAERPNGVRVWFRPYPTPFRDATGAVAGGLNILRPHTHLSSASADIDDRELDPILCPSQLDRHVGIQLRLRRSLLDLSQQQLADRLGKSINDIEDLEDGRVRIGPADLITLSQILDVPVSWFFDNLKPGPHETN